MFKSKKLAWTGLGKVKKGASSAASVFKKFSSRLATDLLLTRGAVDATPFAVAYSLTFSLVKNLKMLLQTGHRGMCCNPCNWDGRYWMPTMVGDP